MIKADVKPSRTTKLTAQFHPSTALRSYGKTCDEKLQENYRYHKNYKGSIYYKLLGYCLTFCNLYDFCILIEDINK